MSHAKMMCIVDVAIIGPCSWTTASRANNEVGVLLDLDSAGGDRLETMFEGLPPACRCGRRSRCTPSRRRRSIRT
eukprot:4058572-Alexandrium_andersonii.AAC.1